MELVNTFRAKPRHAFYDPQSDLLGVSFVTESDGQFHFLLDESGIERLAQHIESARKRKREQGAQG